jgi:hypothetical protein
MQSFIAVGVEPTPTACSRFTNSPRKREQV